MTNKKQKQPRQFAVDMLKAFYNDQTKEKSFELSNLIRSEMICLQEKDNVNFIQCENITEYLLINTVVFLINADKSKIYSIEGDIKNLRFTFSVFTENMTNRQIRYFNSEYELDIPENQKEIIKRDEEAEEAMQALFTKGIW